MKVNSRRISEKFFAKNSRTFFMINYYLTPILIYFNFEEFILFLIVFRNIFTHIKKRNQ